VQCFQRISKLAELIIIDTPGFVRGPTAAALWWTVERILQPELILAVQRNDELQCILGGLQSVGHRLEQIECPPQMPTKSPQERQRYRQNQFNKYFRDSCLYNISLSEVAVQRSRNLSSNSLINWLVALRDGKGVDIAIGQVKDWQCDKGVAVVRAPQIDIRQIRCFVIGDVTIEITDE
jgi:polynucleotide 5'-kinase involved in rRNA processing